MRLFERKKKGIFMLADPDNPHRRIPVTIEWRKPEDLIRILDEAEQATILLKNKYAFKPSRTEA